jgi:hypothetical protein
MFPSAVIPLAAACKLAMFGTGGCCAAMTGQNGDCCVACFAKGMVHKGMVVKGMVG